MSDLIKHFSNNLSNITIIIVGIADTVTQLFDDHQSISRCCTQLRMPRMSPDELENIVNERVPRLGMTIEDATKERMLRYSQGLPGYMHLLGQLSASGRTGAAHTADQRAATFPRRSTMR